MQGRFGFVFIFIFCYMEIIQANNEYLFGIICFKRYINDFQIQCYFEEKKKLVPEKLNFHKSYLKLTNQPNQYKILVNKIHEEKI